MDTLLVNGDHRLDARGLPTVIDGDRALIQRALIRLGVRRGSLPREPALGSELHKLRGARPDVLERLALSYVQEALTPMVAVTGDGVAVEGVSVVRDDRDSIAVEVTIGIGARTYRLEVEVP